MVENRGANRLPDRDKFASIDDEPSLYETSDKPKVYYEDASLDTSDLEDDDLFL